MFLKNKSMSEPERIILIKIIAIFKLFFYGKETLLVLKSSEPPFLQHIGISNVPIVTLS